MDRFSGLLPRFGFNTSTFYKGQFCGSNLFQDDQFGQLHLVSTGEVLFEHNDGTSLHIREPAVVVYPRPLEHRLIVPPSCTVDLVCANISFNEVQRNPIALALPEILHIPLDRLPELKPILQQLFDEANGNELGHGLVMDRLCDILVVHLIRYVKKTGQGNPGVLLGLSHPSIAPAINAIHRNPAHPWRVEELAELVNMSRTSFMNYFREAVGMPPAEYLISWRMGLAETLLTEKRSVKSTALAIGYGSQSAFSKAFFSRYGISPTQWQKQHVKR